MQETAGRTQRFATPRFSLAWVLCALCLLCLTACPGNGGAQDSVGTTYSSSGGSGSGSSISADDIRNFSNSDDFGKVIELLSGGSSGGSGGEGRGTTSVDLSTDGWGIPAGGGTVTITMTVDGETRTYISDITDGKVHFDIDDVPTDSMVKVKMDVRDSSGAIILTGRTEKTVSGEEDVLDVRLSDTAETPLSPDFVAQSIIYKVTVGTDSPQYLSNISSISAKVGEIVTVVGLALMNDGSLQRIDKSFISGEEDELALSINTDAGKVDKNWPSISLGYLYDGTTAAIFYNLTWVGNLAIDAFYDFTSSGYANIESQSFFYTESGYKGTLPVTEGTGMDAGKYYGSPSGGIFAGMVTEMGAVFKVTVGGVEVTWRSTSS